MRGKGDWEGVTTRLPPGLPPSTPFLLVNIITIVVVMIVEDEEEEDDIPE